MKRWTLLAIFVVLVLGGGWAIGFVARPDAWYAALTKPSFNPPNFVFAPVWTLLYVLIAIAGWRTFLRARRGAAMALWAAALILNFAWSPTFFGAHNLAAALAIILALLAAILGFIGQSWKPDRAAALLFVPYAAWVAFASLLNAAIWHLNG
ncbi:MAG: TspO/MBR family protein [Variibacter sp.]